MDDVGSGCEVETCSCCFEGEDEDSVGAVVLESVNHFLALLDATSAMEEHGDGACVAGNELLEHVAHFLELGEDDCFFASFTYGIDEGQKHFCLSRKRGDEFSVLEILRGVVANLLQGQHHLKNEALTLEELPAVGFINSLDDFHAFVDHLLIERGLLGGEHGKFVLFNFVGEVVDDGLVGLQSAHHHGGGDAAETLGTGFIAEFLDGFGVFFVESLDGSQISFVGKVHDAPVFRKAIFNGGAAHGDVDVGFQRAYGFALRCVVVLDVLRFIDHDDLPFVLFELFDVGADEAVGSEQDVVGEVVQISFGAVVEMDRQGWGEALQFGLPVGEQSCRCDNEGFLLVQQAVDLEFLEEGDDLEGLSESHVVSEDASESQQHVVVHPREAPFLIGTELGMDFFGHGDRSQRGQLGNERFHFRRNGDGCAVVVSRQCRLQHSGRRHFPL